MSQPRLYEPISLRSVTARNRIVISPMCQYSATDGLADDWHLVHLGKFAQGGAGIVFVEATAVVPEGRITHGDVGIWSDAHVPPLRRVADVVKRFGGVPAIQLGHAGRKASMQRPWHGNGPMDESDRARGEMPWRTVAPSAIPIDTGWIEPAALDTEEMARLKDSWREATLRAAEAGFQIVEIHGAHGYLLQSFLSPIANKRNDAYGGDREGRMRFPLEVVETVRAAWPENLPLFVRISATDWIEGGWTIEDSVAFARELKARGVDVVDCSSGGITGSATAGRIPRELGYQVPFAAQVRREAGIATMAVGLIVDPEQAEAVLAAGDADLVAIAREALADPNWPLHARLALGDDADAAYADWPQQYGWWLQRRHKMLQEIRGRS